MFLTFTKECLEAAISELTRIECNTGLKISYEKTTIYRLGSLKNSDAKIYTTKQLNWSSDDIEMLGITIKNGATQDCTGYDSVINKLNNVANDWQNRQLTLMGKVIIVNTLLCSLFIYRMSVLPMMSNVQLKRMEQIINNFLWNGKHAKIPHKVLCSKKSDGGLGLTDLNVRQAAMKIQWVKKTADSQFQYVFSCLNPLLMEKIWECNIHVNDVKDVIQCECFWSDVLKIWSKYHFFEPQNRNDILNQIIWYNSKIRVGKKIMPINKKAIGIGILYIRDLISEAGKFLTHNEICTLFGEEMRTEWLWLTQVKKALPVLWISTLNEKVGCQDKESESTGIDTLNYNNVIVAKKCSALVYSTIKNMDVVDMSKYGVKLFQNWGEEYNEEEFLNEFRLIKILSSDTRTINFYYRFLLGKIYCNDMLFKWGITSNPNCEWCHNVKQTRFHLFWECTMVQTFWSKLQNEMLRTCDINETLT